MLKCKDKPGILLTTSIKVLKYDVPNYNDVKCSYKDKNKLLSQKSWEVLFVILSRHLLEDRKLQVAKSLEVEFKKGKI